MPANVRSALWSVVLAAVVLLGGHRAVQAEWLLDKTWGGMHRSYSIDERIRQFGQQARARLAPSFEAAGMSLPPAEVALLAFKDTRVVELYARAVEQPWRRVRAYPILAASGTSGPKLREGDLQVPEGVYEVTLLNPNSRFHVSLRLGYPNQFDRAMAESEGRTQLGGDIMIHGAAQSVGCLAVGDAAAEELFFLAAAVGLPHVKVIISPTDFRRGALMSPAGTAPAWTIQLYTALASELAHYASGF